jgi:uncharacterized protein YodC (DUF2158 family)
MIASTTLLLMANGGFRTINEIGVGEQINGGTVTGIRSGMCDCQWVDFNGVHLGEHHIVFEDGFWKYAKDAVMSKRIPPYGVYYSVNTTSHRLFGINNTTLADAVGFDHDHPARALERVQSDEVIEYLNGIRVVNGAA